GGEFHTMNTTSRIMRLEYAGAPLGVEGRFTNVIVWPEDEQLPKRCRGKIAHQRFIASRPCNGGTLIVTVRFDDNCKNGHETLSITGELIGKNVKVCGCIHREIARVFPEFKPLIPFHLCSTDGPMHYIAN